MNKQKAAHRRLTSRPRSASASPRSKSAGNQSFLQHHRDLTLHPHDRQQPEQHVQCEALLTATAQNVDSLALEFIQAMGSPQAAAVAFAKASFLHAPTGTPARATQLAMAFLIEQGSLAEGALKRLVQLNGNMQLYYRDDMSLFGTFISRYPEAACGIPHWSSHQPEPVEALALRCSRLISLDAAPLLVEEFLKILGNPSTQEQFLESMAREARLGNVMMGDAQRLATVAAAISTASSVSETIQQLENSGLNLYQVLEPMHLGLALSTMLISWDQVREWTMEARRPPELPQLTDDAGLGSCNTGMGSCASSQATTESAAASPVQPWAPQRNKQKLLNPDGVLFADYADLRRLYPPVDPRRAKEDYVAMAASPRAPPNTMICKFEAPNMTDLKERRWLWWQALSRVKVFVEGHYLHTPYQQEINATSSGNVGQLVVRCGLGTITWVPNDRRIIVSHSSRILRDRLCAGFEAWDPERDMASKYHHNKVPQQIQRMLTFKGETTSPASTTSQPLFQ